MNREIRKGFIVRLPEDFEQDAVQTLTVETAWRNFTQSLKGVDLQMTENSSGPAKQRRRRRRGGLHLAMAEPPSAA